MKYRKSQLDSCQGACESGVTIGNRLSSQSGSFAFSSTEQNNNVLCTVLFSQSQDTLLVFQVHCTSGSSHKALRGGEHHLGTCALSALLDGHSGNAVTVTNDDNLLAS